MTDIINTYVFCKAYQKHEPTNPFARLFNLRSQNLDIVSYKISVASKIVPVSEKNG